MENLTILGVNVSGLLKSKEMYIGLAVGFLLIKFVPSIRRMAFKR